MELTEGLEDYLEAMLLCDGKHRYVRTKHLAQRLGVKSPCVSAAVKELARLGLVEHEAYGFIELTPKGRHEAERVLNRHRILFQFLSDILGLPEEYSEVSACGIEHHFDEYSINKLKKLLDFLDKKAKEDETFLKELNDALTDEDKA